MLHVITIDYSVLVAFVVGSYGPMITYMFEIVGAEYRSQITILIPNCMYAIGMGFVALIAQLCQHWWWLMFILFAITIPFPLLVHFVVPESYLFLYSTGRYREARNAAESFPEKCDEYDCMDFAEMVRSVTTSQSNVYGTTGICGNKFMTISLIIMLVIW